jgi:hypothetical protein
MTSEDVIDVVLRWMHILGAIMLVGGIFYQSLVLGQISNPISETEAERTARELQRKRWSIIVMIATTLLLISGLVNTALISMRYEFPGGLYHALLAVKLVAALVVFFLASVITGRSALAERVRASGKPWLTRLVIVSVLTVAIASVMKNLEHVPKERDDVSTEESVDRAD